METVALIISGISLFAVVYQNLNMKVKLSNQIYVSFITNLLEIDRLLITYPEARKYVYGGEAVDENTPDIERLMSIMEFIIDTTENVEVYQKYLPNERRKNWIVFIEDMRKMPLYQYCVSKHEDWFQK